MESLSCYHDNSLHKFVARHMVKNRRVLYLEKLKINPQKYKVNTNPETKRIKMALEKLFSGKVDFKISKIVKAFTN